MLKISQTQAIKEIFTSQEKNEDSNKIRENMLGFRMTSETTVRF